MSHQKILHPNLPFHIHTDVVHFDHALVHKWLSIDAYWSEGIPADLLRKALRNSLSFGVFRNTGEQVGVARMVTDSATFGYLADVFLCPKVRGQGLAKWLMKTIMEHPELQGLRRTMLATRDMHPLYRQYGFKDIKGHPLLMEITVPDIYIKNI